MGERNLGDTMQKISENMTFFAMIAEEYLEISRAMLKSTRVTLS